MNAGTEASGGPAEELIVSRSGGILQITINRPRVRNAMVPAVANGIAAALDELDSDAELRVAVLTGAGGAFCTGLDLKAFLAGAERGVPGRGFGGLTEAPPRKPLIAAVEGYALAGGFEMVLACDLVVAAEDAIFGLPEAKRGLVAGSGGLLRLGHRIPYHRAMECVLLGDNFGAAQAHEWGLVNRMVAPGEALATALELAERVAANAPLAVLESKRTLQEAPNWPGPEDWEAQRELVARIVDSEDAAEGAGAFLEKRPPRWKGA